MRDVLGDPGTTVVEVARRVGESLADARADGPRGDGLQVDGLQVVGSLVDDQVRQPLAVFQLRADAQRRRRAARVVVPQSADDHRRVECWVAVRLRVGTSRASMDAVQPRHRSSRESCRDQGSAVGTHLDDCRRRGEQRRCLSAGSENLAPVPILVADRRSDVQGHQWEPRDELTEVALLKAAGRPRFPAAWMVSHPPRVG